MISVSVFTIFRKTLDKLRRPIESNRHLVNYRLTDFILRSIIVNQIANYSGTNYGFVDKIFQPA